MSRELKEGEKVRIKGILAATVWALYTVAPQVAGATDLKLACGGVNSYTRTSIQSTNTVGGNGQMYLGQSMQRYNGANAGEIQIEIEDAGKEPIARIKLPPSMVPLFSGGTKDGWRELRNVTITTTDINGRFSINPLEQPKVHINRLSGAMDVHSFRSLNFQGQCELVSEEAPKF